MCVKFSNLASLYDKRMDRKVYKHNPDSRDLTSFSSDEGHFLVLHNDEVNTFDFVIKSLVMICGHDPAQAEQCAFITHHHGECDIKKGEIAILEPMQERLLIRGLLVTIE